MGQALEPAQARVGVSAGARDQVWGQEAALVRALLLLAQSSVVARLGLEVALVPARSW